MIIKLFSLWLILTPFIIWDGFYEGPKVFVFSIAGFLLAIYWIIKIVKEPGTLKLDKKDLWYFAWLGILTISSLFGVHPQNSFLGGSYRHQGVIFFLTLWMAGKTLEMFGNNGKKMLFKGIGLAVLAEGIIVLYQIIFGKLYLGKPLGTLGEANAVAGFLAMGSYFVFISFPKAALAIPAISVILSQSRAGILAFGANAGFLLNYLNKKSRIMLAVLAVAAATALAIYFSLSKGMSPFESRQVIWPIAFRQVLNNPVIGYGAESGEVVFDKAFSQRGIPLSDLIIDRAHNLFLDVAMWSGILGLISFGWWLYLSYKDLEGSKKFAFFAFLIYSMLQPLSVVHWILLAVILKA